MQSHQDKIQEMISFELQMSHMNLLQAHKYWVFRKTESDQNDQIKMLMFNSKESST